MPVAVKSTRKPYRALLLKKRDELLASLKSEDEALSVSIQSPDAVEFALKAADQDVVAATAELRTRMLKEVESALKRVASGTYGVCEHCGEDITRNRLLAIPWARYCLSCEERRIRN